jgi:hypothetical protein
MLTRPEHRVPTVPSTSLRTASADGRPRRAVALAAASQRPTQKALGQELGTPAPHNRPQVAADRSITWTADSPGEDRMEDRAGA